MHALNGTFLTSDAADAGREPFEKAGKRRVGARAAGRRRWTMNGEVVREVRLARRVDLDTYTALAKVAQAWLESRSLGQYVPAAHDEYAAEICSRIESRTLYALWLDNAAVAFFSADSSPSKWWPEQGVSALYLGGIVVAMEARGRRVGEQIIEWCVAEARRLGRQFVRLECHADNPWLCRYYESHGFTIDGRVEQYPGYDACLYQRVVATQEAPNQPRQPTPAAQPNGQGAPSGGGPRRRAPVLGSAGRRAE